MENAIVTTVYVTSLFRRQADRLKIPQLEEKAVQAVRENPLAGAVIPGTHGLRKIRIALPGRGKRGGARVLYVLVLRKAAYLLSVLSKNQEPDFPPAVLRTAELMAEELRKSSQA